MKILVTGHLGFIGSNLVPFLESLGHNVVGCSRRNGCDITDVDMLKSKIRDCDLAYHLAADAKPAESLLTPWQTMETNLKTTVNVALACRDANIPLVYVSSCEIYGDNDSPITEEAPILPTNPYAASKAASDRMLYSFNRCYGLDVKIVRLFNPYGPHQQLNKIFPTFYRLARSNQPLTVYGDGKDSRDYVFIEDIVHGLWEATRLPSGEAINLATGVRTYTIDAANLMIKATGSSSTIQLTPYPKIFGGIRYQVGSGEKAQRLLRWHYTTPLELGVRKTIQWLESLEEIKIEH